MGHPGSIPGPSAAADEGPGHPRISNLAAVQEWDEVRLSRGFRNNCGSFDSAALRSR
jgi:hypothetical protein